MRIVTLEDIENAYRLGKRHCVEDIDEFGAEAARAQQADDLFNLHDPMEIVLTLTGEKEVDEADLLLSSYEDGYEDGFYV